jgi:SAM-dependent methyltransferase
VKEKIYDDLASWWPLFSAPSDYVEEAAFFHTILDGAMSPAPRTVLELGSGGGNNASHMKAWYDMTLVDVAPGMVEVSRKLNPECGHAVGDMRTLRLGKTFDAVFVHDAICYMTSEADVRAALRTAWEHCRPGGVAVIVPDDVRETFASSSSMGGHDDDERCLRYLEWHDDPDPADSTSVTDYAIMLRDRSGTRVVHDRHVHGLFGRGEWLAMLREAGFEPEIVRDEWGRDVFIARRRD